MPFRFRKIISLGKGFRINLSKGGISSSIGKPGATLNISKRGARPTFSAPGTGISFTPSMSASSSSPTGTGAAQNKGLRNLITFAISGVLICIISICCFWVIFLPPAGSTSTPTAQAEIPLDQIVAFTANAAQAQTLAAASPIPTFTPFDYVTPSAFIQPTLAPTWTPAPTDTPFVLPLVTYPAGNSGGQCVCNQDVYNCGDALAETCFAACNAQGAGDIHRLDQNNNGNACDNN